ncbi:MAG: 50S ribosomal protein L17 [bacterium]|nr:50S ribosomal protein L17 [bacterium]
MERKLGRKKANREHLLRNLVTSLILYERITTTRPKAKEVKKEIDRLITTAKKNNLVSYRQVMAYVFDDNAAKKIKEILIPRFTTRTSGFTKSYHYGKRTGDAAEMTIVELIQDESKTEDSVQSKTDKVIKTKKTP